MARIRSVHPSFFTDEACVSCSALARLLYIGLWTDADDQGIFEWKPIQIKMRLLAGDNADAAALLEELRSATLITEFSHKGNRFGAIRDFRKFQRPKKPNSVHFMPPELRTYVALDKRSSDQSAPDDDDDPEPVPHQSPTGGGKSPQMEDGGWRMEGRMEDGGSGSIDPSHGDLRQNPSGRELVLTPEPASPRRAKSGATATADIQQAFDLFWQHYPLKKAKQAALDAFIKVAKSGSVTFPDLMAGVSAYAGERAGKDPKGTAHAATWLNGSRWTDEPAPDFVPESRRNGRLGGWSGLDQALDGMDFTEAFT